MKDLEGKIHLVASLPLFRTLSKKEQHWVAETVQIVEKERNEILFRSGDSEKSLYLILSGTVELQIPKGGEAKNEEIETLKKGQYFGIQSLLTGEKNHQTAVTLTESRFLVLHQKDFQLLLKKIPYLSIIFSKMLTKSLRSDLLGGREYFHNSVVCLVHSDPRTRSDYALHLVTSIEKESGKKAIILHFNQKEMEIENPNIKRYKFQAMDKIKEALARHYADYAFIFLEVFPEDPESLSRLLLEEADYVENLISTDKDKNLCSQMSSHAKENETLYHETNILQVIEHGKYDIHIRRKSRELSGVQVGLALGGGAALGLTQVGIMKALEEEGIQLDMIAGTSIGAVIGAFFASGLGYKGILPLLEEIDSIFKMLKLVDLSFPGQGLLHGKNVRNLLEKYLGDLYFEDLPTKLRLISCDITTRQEIVLSEGKVLDAVMASVSIPGVFVPQPQENGKIYVDGGIVNPLPVSPLTQEGIQRIIAVNSMPSSKDEMKTNKLLNLNVLDIIVNSLYSLQYRIGKYSAQEADVYLNPILPNSNWFEFWRSSEFIELGERVTKQAMPEIKALFSNQKH